MNYIINIWNAPQFYHYKLQPSYFIQATIMPLLEILTSELVAQSLHLLTSYMAKINLSTNID